MWKHVITETTFWTHTSAAALERQNNRNLNETVQENLWQEKIHQVLAVSTDVKIPSVFIDPVAQIFVDPCNPKYTQPEQREVEKFIEYTDK